MMESREQLLESIELYQTQLEQVEKALACDSESKEELLSLKANLSELLELTKQSLQVLDQKQDVQGEDYSDPQDNSQLSVQEASSELPADDQNDPFAREYALFKAELEASEASNQADEEAVDIQEELNALIGSKCQAPYTDKLNVKHYYNALVLSTHVPESACDLDHIEVRVMFINPVERDMIPCPYYLDGKCKFSDNKCNFSHGYLVSFSHLREYREPEFSSLKKGSHVLAKIPSKDTWISTRVEDIVSHDCVSIRHEGLSITIPLHDTFPLSSSSPDDGEEEDIEEIGNDVDLLQPQSLVSDEAVERSLSDPLGSKRRFGEWEQHTKGIGSKLMAKMGYVVGAGLGKSGEGILDPVQAVILPPGKSLDHCMNLREASGGSKDLFSVERLQKKLALKAQRRSALMYRRNKQKEQNQNNVFNIINNMAQVSKKPEEDFSSRKFKRKLESSSERSLNVEKLKTEETMERMSRDIYILSDKLSMKKEGSTEYKHIAAKLHQAREELETLQKKNGKIAWEINVRETKKKMAF